MSILKSLLKDIEDDYIKFHYNDIYKDELHEIINKSSAFKYDKFDLEFYQRICKAMNFKVDKKLIKRMKKDIEVDV